MPAIDETLAESGAIKALGHLFKITEVFLQDDATVSFHERSVRHDYVQGEEEPTISCITDDTVSSMKHVIEDYTSAEDFQLAQQMDALGLPTSFSTTKEKNSGAIKGKRERIQARSVFANKDTETKVHEPSKISLLEDNASSRVLHDTTNILAFDKSAEGNNGASYHDVDGDDDFSRNDGDSLSIAIHGDSRKQVGDDRTDLTLRKSVEYKLDPGDLDDGRRAKVLEHSLGIDPENFQLSDPKDIKSGVGECEEFSHKQASEDYMECSSLTCIFATDDVDDCFNSSDPCSSSMESSLPFSSADHHVPYSSDNSIYWELGDWRVIFDPFYKINYFYNVQSQESTWYPPAGLEHFAMSPNICKSDEFLTDELVCNEPACDAIQDSDLSGLHDRSSLFEEKGNDLEYLSHSSAEVISSSTSMDFTATSGFEGSNELAVVKKTAIAHSLLEPEVLDHSSTDELNVKKYWEKQEKGAAYLEACSLPDKMDGLTATYNGIGYDEESNGSPGTGLTSATYELENFHAQTSSKKKKRVRRSQSCLSLQVVDEGLPDSIMKYWCQRYLLFSQFDRGIKMDEEGWFSVTPESIARHHAYRCGTGITIDCFTGVGGNAIQFAMKSNHVIAIDIDAQRIDYAQQNATIYGVSDRINFIKGDFFTLAPRLKGDIIFMSPPWGGPDYNKVEVYDIRSMLKPHDGPYLFKVARMIASKVVMFLPRNVDLNQLAELSLSLDPPWAVEVEKNYLNGKLKAITVYFDKPEL